MKVFPSGAKTLKFDTLDSTSLEAKRCAQSGETGPLWIIAIRQTAAYGRRQRAWEQRAGDLATTLLFEPEAPLERFGQLSFVTSLESSFIRCDRSFLADSPASSNEYFKSSRFEACEED